MGPPALSGGPTWRAPTPAPPVLLPVRCRRGGAAPRFGDRATNATCKARARLSSTEVLRP
eukprot:364743-Chlamydomonas_euryale.AAC.49